MAKCVKIISIILIIMLTAILAAIASYFIVTSGTRLDPEKLEAGRRVVTIYDKDGNRLENASVSDQRVNIDANDLHDYTKNAFIASEDRDFYRHNGLNYKRMLKALYRNVTSFRFREGASTISQQLIKNTHLTGDKTISRKLKEIRLTRQLEKKYDKDTILSMYLNTIYFGHNCYGLDSAAHFYFNVDAEDLTLNQSATIAGLLSSPNNYSPFKNAEKCKARRDLVLKSMLECGFISEDEYNENVRMPIGAVENRPKSRYGDYITAMFDELGGLDIDPYSTDEQLNVYTCLDRDLQLSVEEMQFDCDNAVIVRNREGGIEAFKSTIGQAKRQIGSTAKPIFVYAPAIDSSKIHLFTRIEDAPVNYGGYSPENYDKKYHGTVTAEESIIYSYNIPAVKVLNAMGVDNAAKYAENMGVTLSDDDKNLALALGGMKSGLDLRQLTDCYSALQNDGNFSNSYIIAKVTSQSGKVLYERSGGKRRVFSEGTAHLMTDALIKTNEQGTGRYLKERGYQLATKTGTCGNQDGNTDAYAVSYTTEHCIAVWLGDKDNKRLEITGGNDCCKKMKEILDNLYADTTPPPFDTNAGTKEIEIDRQEYEMCGNVLLSDDHSPILNRLKVKCLSTNIPKVKSNNFSKPSIKKPSILVDNTKICIVLYQTKYYEYLIYRQNDKGKKLIYDGKWQEKIEDCPSDGSYLYSVVAYYDDGKNKFVGDEIVLPQVRVSSATTRQTLPDIVNRDWCNE